WCIVRIIDGEYGRLQDKGVEACDVVPRWQASRRRASFLLPVVAAPKAAAKKRVAAGATRRARWKYSPGGPPDRNSPAWKHSKRFSPSSTRTRSSSMEQSPVARAQ